MLHVWSKLTKKNVTWYAIYELISTSKWGCKTYNYGKDITIMF